MSAPDPEAAAFRERTVLAWQRTALSVLVGALVLLRLAGGDGFGRFAVVVGIVVAGLLSAVVMVETRRRVAVEAEARGGRVALLLAVSVTILLLVELWVAVNRS